MQDTLVQRQALLSAVAQLEIEEAEEYAAIPRVQVKIRSRRAEFRQNQMRRQKQWAYLDARIHDREYVIKRVSLIAIDRLETNPTEAPLKKIFSKIVSEAKIKETDVQSMLDHGGSPARNELQKWQDWLSRHKGDVFDIATSIAAKLLAAKIV